MDYYLKTLTEAEMNETLLAAGLVGEDGTPALGVSIDTIGPFTRWDCSVDPPVPIEYPEWHVNIRSYNMTEEQLAEIADILLVPPEQPFRVFA